MDRELKTCWSPQHGYDELHSLKPYNKTSFCTGEIGIRKFLELVKKET